MHSRSILISILLMLATKPWSSSSTIVSELEMSTKPLQKTSGTTDYSTFCLAPIINNNPTDVIYKANF
ncbi:uncharacterized protein SCDLUD_001361 [Saccharomycodes ludwigii]|uniref:uncharacterized protein n=1 Tax=Saccharomycodes ludwigii TaxID=36035 RepID=UPI001E8598CF|nr:hypothetical protein SCDLUD_001361 [Saccharomycodes ludwigii]KAH3901597.1 hypothetical protein SCDLUD_001361 [Saccharomycodes ludwigii]